MLDLSLYPELKTKKIIALGEMAHGSSGLHSMAAQLFKSAVLHLGTRTFGLEAPMGIVEQINKKLSSANPEPLTKTDVADLYPIWRSKGLFSLSQWIFEFNHRPDRSGTEIQFFGFDVRLPASEIVEVLAWADAQGIASETLEPLRGYSVAKLREIEMLSFQDRSAEAAKIFNRLSHAIGAVEAMSGAPERIQFLLKRLQGWLSVYTIWAKTGKLEPGHAERDRQMALLLQQIMSKHHHTGPVVLLAHLNHLLRHNLEVEKSRPHVVSGPMVGNYLSQVMGDKLAVIGLFASNVELADATNPPTKFIAQPGSFEALLHKAYGDNVLKRVSDLPAELSGRIRVGDVLPQDKAQLASYSDFYMVPGRQMDYVVITGFASTQKPF